MRKILLCAVLIITLALTPVRTGQAASTVKVDGYITAKPDASTLQILDDKIHLAPSTRFEVENPTEATQKLGLADLAPGMLIEAEGKWTAHHHFQAEKIVCDGNQFDRKIREHAYLQTEPGEAVVGQNARLKVDGEILTLNAKTERHWSYEVAGISATSDKQDTQTALVGRQVRYQGIREPDGTIAAERIELGTTAPADAYKMPGGVVVVRGVDPQTKIQNLEFRKGGKVQGRLKLFEVKEVQDYVTQLGNSLLPPAKDVTARALEFRFFVVEDPAVNAEALPDGTILVNTSLLGAVENESQLAFVLSHEVAHVLQAHHWREVNETRPKRVAVVVAAVASAYFSGYVAYYLGEVGLAAVVNGYSRRMENQADRLGLQNVIDHGYDPRPAVGFFRMMIERYSDRTTSALWSSHDSSLMRGSFLAVQLEREYPAEQFDHATVDTERFRAMKEAMGPIKIM